MLFETSEEIYSKAIVRNVIEELSEDIFSDTDYDTTELLLGAELQVYKIAFPSLDIDIVEDIVREYLYHHNYLEYARLIEGSVKWNFNEESDALYIKCNDDLSGDVVGTVDVGDGFFFDLDENGLVKGVELLGCKDFFGFSDGEELKQCVVRMVIGRDLLRVCVSFNVGDEGGGFRVRHFMGLFVNTGFGEDFVGCCCLYSNNTI